MINSGGVLNVEADGDAGTTMINSGGVLNVESVGKAGTTTINSGGVENVESGGKAEDTIIDSGGVLNVAGGTDENPYVGGADTTTINSGGVENDAGQAIDTTIKGGVLNVEVGGEADDTTINSGGILNVKSGSIADNVIFGPHATLNLATPSGLQGTITNWHVGDVIDFLNTDVTSVHQTGNTLTVTIDRDLRVNYTLSGLQANTDFKLQSDGHGGTDLILVPVVGVQHHEAA